MMKTPLSNQVFGATSVLVLVLNLYTTLSERCVSYETYNLGLINDIGNITTRRPAIIDKLRNSTSDFLCLQEVWMEQDMQAILEGLKDVFPHHYSFIHSDVDELRESSPDSNQGLIQTEANSTACTGADVRKMTVSLGICARAKGCFFRSGTEYGECILNNCRHVLKDVVQDNTIRASCVACFTTHGFSSLTETLKACIKRGETPNRMNGPGLLVLSKERLAHASYSSYFPGHRMTITRGYIVTTSQDNRTTVCSQLSSNMGRYLELDLDFGSYEVQQRAEIDTLNKTFGHLSHVLLGDLNTGPTVIGQDYAQKNILGEFEDNYQLLLNLGYTSPYDEEDGRCTYCQQNPYTKGYPSVALDHVMVKDLTNGSFFTSGVARLHDTDSPVLSDHYGVQVNLCSRP